MRNISSLLASVSLCRDRSFRSTPKIGHDLAKQLVTIDRNHWSRLNEMTGHDAPKYAGTTKKVKVICMFPKCVQLHPLKRLVNLLEWKKLHLMEVGYFEL
jgi:hypothetical protein